jgi:hypothetical protein
MSTALGVCRNVVGKETAYTLKGKKINDERVGQNTHLNSDDRKK